MAESDDVISRIILRLHTGRQWTVHVKGDGELNVRDFNLAIRTLEVEKGRYLRNMRLEHRLQTRASVASASAPVTPKEVENVKPTT